MPDSASLWRQARDTEDHVEWFESDTGQMVPRLRIRGTGRAVGMQFDPDLSVVWKDHLTGHSLHEADLTSRNSSRGPLIFQANAGDIRNLRAEGKRFYVVYTPTDDDPFGCSHVSVLELFKKSRDTDAARNALRTDLQKLMKLVWGDCTVPVPDGA